MWVGLIGPLHSAMHGLEAPGPPPYSFYHCSIVAKLMGLFSDPLSHLMSVFPDCTSFGLGNIPRQVAIGGSTKDIIIVDMDKASNDVE